MVDVLGLAGLVVGSAGLIAGAAALVELPYVERLKKPELEIRPVIWQPADRSLDDLRIGAGHQ